MFFILNTLRWDTKQHSISPVSRLDKCMVILSQKKHLANIPTSTTLNVCKQFRVNTAKLNISREKFPCLHSAYRELKNKTFQSPRLWVSPTWLGNIFSHNDLCSQHTHCNPPPDHRADSKHTHGG